MTYFVVNLPISLAERKREFITALDESSDLSIFEQEYVQVIIDFKWNTYTK